MTRPRPSWNARKVAYLPDHKRHRILPRGDMRVGVVRAVSESTEVRVHFRGRSVPLFLDGVDTQGATPQPPDGP